MNVGRLIKVPLSLLDDPRAPSRSAVDQGELDELAESMSRRGLLQPIGVVEREGRYEVNWGHRRTMAARMLGWPEIPARLVVRDEHGLLLDRAHENLFRANLSPVEEAEMCRALLVEAGGDIEKLTRMISRSVGWIEARLDLLKWPEDVRTAVDAGQISRAAAKPLSAVTDDKERDWLLKNAIEFGVSERVTRAWFQNWQLSGHIADPTLIAAAAGTPVRPSSNPTAPCFFCQEVDSIGRMPFFQLHQTCADLIAAHRPESVAVSQDRG